MELLTDILLALSHLLYPKTRLGVLLYATLKRNKSHGFGAMHLKEIIKTNHVQLKSRISSSVYSECVLKVGDSGHFVE